MPSTTVPLTWPTTAELDALTALSNSDDESDLMWSIDRLHHQLKGLVNLDVAPSIEDAQAAIERGAEPLTIEHVGALSSCLAKLRFDIDYMRSQIASMERIRDVMALEVVPFSKGGGNA